MRYTIYQADRRASPFQVKESRKCKDCRGSIRFYTFERLSSALKWSMTNESEKTLSITVKYMFYCIIQLYNVVIPMKLDILFSYETVNTNCFFFYVNIYLFLYYL